MFNSFCNLLNQQPKYDMTSFYYPILDIYVIEDTLNKSEAWK